VTYKAYQFTCILLSLAALAQHAPAHGQAANARVCIQESKRCVGTLREALLYVRDGQTITLEPGLYLRDNGIVRANRVTIKSTGGAAARAVMVSQGRVAENKAILVTKGNDITIDGLAFEGARSISGNGAGIRHEGGDLTVRNALFDRNEMGLLSGAHPSAQIFIENTEFRYSERGQPIDESKRRNPAHNIYVGNAAKLSLRGVWSHGAQLGHTLKSRARDNLIEASYFSSRDGTASYEAEFPSGGLVHFIGNIVEQGVDSDNTTLFSFGAEHVSLPNPGPHRIAMHFNTFVNRNAVTGTMVRLHENPNMKPVLDARANIWVGPGKPADEENVALWARELKNMDACDFRPSAVVAATPALGKPRFEYVHPAKYRVREEASVGALSASNASMTPCAP
jgi:hypothetical protein